MRRWVLAIVTTTILSTTARSEADQAAWNSKHDADAGAALIVVGTELRGYCKPCGDKVYEPVVVRSVIVAKPAMDPHGPYFEVRVNGRGVDLAYEYVPWRGRWMNVALLVGLAVVDVPAELPSGLPRKP
jgi:hypothetical protein